MKTYDFSVYCRNTKPFRFLRSIQSDKEARINKKKKTFLLKKIIRVLELIIELS